MQKRSRFEFISLMALLISMVAFSIDAMLPALNQIGLSLGVEDPNDSQLIVAALFLGMSVGLMIYGPLADSFGRKRTLYWGIGIYLAGSLVCLLAQTFDMLLAGRVLQGLGACSSRIVCTAMIRDRFEGARMARVMSFILTIFVIVPMLAPSIGQGILLFAGWHAIFWAMLSLGVIGLVWLHFRQGETLAPENRRPFSARAIWSGVKQTLGHPVSRAYTLAAGFGFGAFIGYLGSAQQIIQFQYGQGEMFAIWFAVLAFAIGLASFANTKLVTMFEMDRLCEAAMMIIALAATAMVMFGDGNPPFIVLMLWMGLTKFCFGILFGNVNALALQPLGHIAGVANSVIASVQTLISVGVGALIGQSYDGTIIPLATGFALCVAISLVIVVHARIRSNPA